MIIITIRHRYSHHDDDTTIAPMLVEQQHWTLGTLLTIEITAAVMERFITSHHLLDVLLTAKFLKTWCMKPDYGRFTFAFPYSTC